MRHPARSEVVVPGAPHHLVLRGNNLRRLFSYASCYASFLHFLVSAAWKYRVPVHGLALLTHHVHLVVTPRDAQTLAAFVKTVAQRHAMRRNAVRQGTGKCFEQRFTIVPLRTQADVALTLAYVDLDAVRARLVTAPFDFLWSTYRTQAGLVGAHPAIGAAWTPQEWYLALGRDPFHRAAQYREWVRAHEQGAGDLERVARLSKDRDDEARPYTRRLRRPDESRVAEPGAIYSAVGTMRRK